MAIKTAPAPKKPVRVNPETKLTAPQIDVISVLHENDKWHPLAVITTESGLPEKQVKTTVAKLVEMGWILENEKGGSYRYNGLRCKALKLVVGALRLQGSTLTAGQIGAAVWADPSVKDDPKANTRYAPAAYAVLKSAFELGAVYRIESDAQPLFGVIA